MKQFKILTIDQSAFYRLGKKKDLADLIGISVPTMKRLASDSNYREWQRIEKKIKSE